MRLRNLLTLVAAGAALVAADGTASASSHREAPFISKNPKVDASDFYMFRSYETARAGGSAIGSTDGWVTIIANYEPLQDPYGGPNYFSLDPDALYEIHIDNNGDAKEDLTFQFRFSQPLVNNGTGLEIPVPLPGDVDGGPDASMVALPFINDMPNASGKGIISNYTNGVFTGASGTQAYAESYTLTLVTGDRRTGTATPLSDSSASPASTTFYKPVDNIGVNSFGADPNYANYAKTFIRNFSIPGCTPPGGLSPRVFVGQRHESFSVNLGTIFDLINAPAGVITSGYADPGPADNAKGNIFNSKNVTSIALEIPASCLTAATGTDAGNSGAGAGIIGGWTTASVRQARVINPTGSYATPTVEGGAWAQVSRLSNPLVNEVVIGLKDKDLFNSSSPSGDAQFATYVTNPTLAEVIELLFGPTVPAPKVYPRGDLVAAFLTGVTDTWVGGTAPTININTNGAVAEYQRLNTLIPSTAKGSQTALGAAACFVEPTGTPAAGSLKVVNLSATGCDPAGFPNGRRPGDDVVDIELRVMMGYLFANDSDAPARAVGFTDGAHQGDDQFDATFPYLQTPYAGAPNTSGVN
jgi:hypothetical protein